MFSVGFFLFVIFLAPIAVSSNTECSRTEFPCDSGKQCVERKKWCDKHPDCDDASDEKYCKPIGWFNTDPNGCFEKDKTHYYCDSGICLPLVAECDGYDDCKDGEDEKYCNQSQTESSQSLSSNIESFNEVYSPRDVQTTASIISTHKTSPEVIHHHKEDKQVETVTSSTTRATYSSRVNGPKPAASDYYGNRLKEAHLETKLKVPALTAPKEIPIRVTESAQRIRTTNLFIPTTPHTVSSERPFARSHSTFPPRSFDRQSQTFKQRTNLPSINHYQLHSNGYHIPPKHNQSPSSRHHPTPNYQPSYNQNQPPPNSYQPFYNQNPPLFNSYPRSYNQNPPLFNSYPRSYNQNPPSSDSYPHSYNQNPPSSYSYHRSYNQYPPSSNSYQSSSDPRQPYHYQPHRPISGSDNNRRRLLNGHSDPLKPYAPEREIKRPFHFAVDYGNLYGRYNAPPIREGVEWLLRQRSSETGDWGRETSRAMVALALSSDESFFNGSHDGELIKRRFMAQLGVDLLRNNTKSFSINRLFMAINGLLAVCEDPTDFHGIDLAKQLRYKIESTRENDRRDRSYLNPFVALSLCLTNKTLTSSEIEILSNQMTPYLIRNERNKDMLSASIMAFSCYVHQISAEDSSYRRSLQVRLRDAVVKLLENGGTGGSFGSIYSTALAAQALMSTNNESHDWNATNTFGFLRQQQRQDGSFGDFLATYWALPALSGKSLLHLRNINCNSTKRELTPKEILEFVGPKQSVRYSLYFGYPLVNSQTLILHLPEGINFLDVMRVAEYQDPTFRFSLENNSSKVYSLSGLPNDFEMGLSWHLYVKHDSSSHPSQPSSRESYTADLRSLSPKPEEIFIFWYHSNDLQ